MGRRAVRKTHAQLPCPPARGSGRRPWGCRGLSVLHATLTPQGHSLWYHQPPTALTLICKMQRKSDNEPKHLSPPKGLQQNPHGRDRNTRRWRSPFASGYRRRLSGWALAGAPDTAQQGRASLTAPSSSDTAGSVALGPQGLGLSCKPPPSWQTPCMARSPPRLPASQRSPRPLLGFDQPARAAHRCRNHASR